SSKEEGRRSGPNGWIAPALDAGGVEEPAEIERLGREVVPDFDLHAIDLEARALVEERLGLAFEVCELDGIDEIRIGREIPRLWPAGLEQPRLLDDLQGAGERVHVGALGGRRCGNHLARFDGALSRRDKREARPGIDIFLVRAGRVA